MLTIWQREALIAPKHKGGICCIVAPRRSGKTYLIKEALRSSKVLVCVPSRLGISYIKSVIQDIPSGETLFPDPTLISDVYDIDNAINASVEKRGEPPRLVYIEEPSFLAEDFFMGFLNIRKSFPSCIFIFIGTASTDTRNGFNQFLFKIHKGEIEGAITKWPQSPFISQQDNLKEAVGEHAFKVEFEAKIPVIDYI